MTHIPSNRTVAIQGSHQCRWTSNKHVTRGKDITLVHMITDKGDRSNIENEPVIVQFLMLNCLTCTVDP